MYYNIDTYKFLYIWTSIQCTITSFTVGATVYSSKAYKTYFAINFVLFSPRP